jgi:uncharacterized protein YjbI with pentapeptide repeats
MIEIKNRNGELIFSCQDNLEPLDLRGANLEDAVLEGAELSYANLEGVNLKGADLYWVILFGANLKKSNLENASLNGADLKEASLRGANLKNADLGPDNLGGVTQLQGADLTDAVLDGMIVSRAAYDHNTKFPSSFDPVAHGMVRMDKEP